MCTTKCATFGTEIHIEKWGIYQHQDNLKCATKSATIRATSRSEKCTTNNIIKVEEDNKKNKKKKNKEGAVAALTPEGVVPPAFRDRFGDDYAAYRRWSDQ